MALNTVQIKPIETQKVRVVFQHAQPKYSGLAELMVWGTRQTITP
jgi:hypothetical protein